MAASIALSRLAGQHLYSAEESKVGIDHTSVAEAIACPWAQLYSVPRGSLLDSINGLQKPVEDPLSSCLFVFVLCVAQGNPRVVKRPKRPCGLCQ